MKYPNRYTALIITFMLLMPSIVIQGSTVFNQNFASLYAGEKTENIAVKKNTKEDIKNISDTETGKKSSLEQPVIIKVMYVIMIIWLGLAIFIFKINRRLSKLEKEINEL